MAQGDSTITICGNLTDDVNLSFTPSGVALAKFRVASTPRYFDKASGAFKDAEPLFLACTAWRELAENAAESLARGSRVVVVGRLKQENWQDKETGQKRSTFVLEVDEVAPSLKWATAKVQRMERSGGNSGRPAQDDGDTWATAAPTSAGNSDEPPPF